MGLNDPSNGAERTARVPKTVRDVITALQAAGWIQVRRNGSHRQFRHAESRWTITVAGKPSKTLAPGTLADIRRKSGLKELR